MYLVLTCLFSSKALTFMQVQWQHSLPLGYWSMESDVLVWGFLIGHFCKKRSHWLRIKRDLEYGRKWSAVRLTGSLSLSTCCHHVCSAYVPHGAPPPVSVSTCGDAGGVCRAHRVQRGKKSSAGRRFRHHPLQILHQECVSLLWQGAPARAKLQPGKMDSMKNS